MKRGFLSGRYVEPCRESPSRTGKNQHVNVLVILNVVERVAELRQQFRTEGVHLLWPVKGKCGDVVTFVQTNILVVHDSP